MEIVTFAALLVLGVVCASNLIIARKPEAKELIAKVAPYQGWIGAVSALWGAWWIVRWILNIGALKAAPVIMLTWLAVSLLLLGLGLLCGIGILKTFIKAPAATEKLDLAVARLAPFQGMLGVAAIAVGLWTVVDLYILKVY
ncbi:MAG TPA: hypothetical protein VE981_13030 [Planctomycetota bacterium]|nr:hypothetical protein [Planctomycetota bacterium]